MRLRRFLNDRGGGEPGVARRSDEVDAVRVAPYCCDAVRGRMMTLRPLQA